MRSDKPNWAETVVKFDARGFRTCIKLQLAGPEEGAYHQKMAARHAYDPGRAKVSYVENSIELRTLRPGRLRSEFVNEDSSG
ncbi:MAG: hypothetical protein KGL75_03180 [Acidobacteriota bacterium]|nr:hypothetical protein [Acidobacteriota bacterium]